MIDLNELNRKFGAAGRIAFRESAYGLPEMVLVNGHGHCDISIYGGQILNYRPIGHAPVLFTSSESAHEAGKRIFGGMPLCWPWFGAAESSELPRHGFARLSTWEVLSTSYDSSSTEVTLGLMQSEQSLALWPHHFELVQKITLSDNLMIEVSTFNRGEQPFAFSQSIHPYFKVRDINRVTIEGLDGIDYTDAVASTTGVQKGPFKISSATYNSFNAPDHAIAIRDEALRRDILLKYSNMQHLVVWNPWREGAAKIEDFGDNEYTGMITVAPVTPADHAVTLKPGEKFIASAAVQVLLA